MSGGGWPAPAKLNLFLHVLGRRPDGYHRLQTVFQLLDLADRVHVDVRRDGRIRRAAGPEGVPEDADLTVRAARALQAHVGERRGAELAVVKRLPLGGGLGGGSSDAATTLLALDRLWGLGLPVAELARIGLALGADVPVFVRGASAWADGVGEDLTPVSLEPAWYAVVHCGVAVSTGAVFGDAALTRDSPPLTLLGFSRAGGAIPVGALMAGTRNDCEAVVTRRHPEVAEALSRLGPGARLTGTGACVFAPFPDAESARAALAGLPEGWWARVARGIDRSPLCEE